MTINRALCLDQTSGAEALRALEAIASQLQDFKAQYPIVFRHLCEAAREGSDFTLADAVSAVNWVSGYLEEGVQ